jgi:hypothetical protein
MKAKRYYIFVTYNCVFKRHSFIIYKLLLFCQGFFENFQKINLNLWKGEKKRGRYHKNLVYLTGKLWAQSTYRFSTW